jgi:TolB-like protein
VVKLRFARSSRLALSVSIAALSLPVPRAVAQGPSTVDRRASVVVLDFNIAALKDASDWAPLAKGIPQILRTELSKNPDIRIVERERLQAVLDELKITASAMVDPATAAKVGKIVGARYMLYGGATIAPNKTMRLDVHGFKTETTVQEYSETLSGKADDVLELVAQLGQKVSKEFDPTPFDAPPIEKNSGNNSRPTKEGLRLAMLLGNAVDLQDRHDVEGAKVLVRQALALVPDNPSAKAMLMTLERTK